MEVRSIGLLVYGAWHGFLDMDRWFVNECIDVCWTQHTDELGGAWS